VRDCIVDLVDTGKTLEANGLESYQTLAAISSRLIVNRGAWKLHHDQVMPVLARLRHAVEANQEHA